MEPLWSRVVAKEVRRRAPRDCSEQLTRFARRWTTRRHRWSEQREWIVTVLEADGIALAAGQSEGRALTLDDAVAYALSEHD